MKLAKTDQAGVRAVQLTERRVIRKALRVIEQGALNATRVNDDGLDDQDSEVILNEREKRIAMDMRRSKRHAPVYLEVMLRRIESAEKADALRAQSAKPALNIGVIVQVQGPEYPVLDVTTRQEEA